jgi:hypothetical protein
MYNTNSIVCVIWTLPYRAAGGDKEVNSPRNADGPHMGMQWKGKKEK